MPRIRREDFLTPENLTRLTAWARDGLTNEQIAHNIGVSEATWYRWLKQSCEICEAIKKGKEVVDAEVENALLKRALGFTCEETMTETSPEGVKTRTTKKIIPPDVGAAIFWLKNRRPDKWKDKPVDETDAAALTAARTLLEGVRSVIGRKP